MEPTSSTSSAAGHVLCPDRLATLGVTFADVGIWLYVVVARTGVAG